MAGDVERFDHCVVVVKPLERVDKPAAASTAGAEHTRIFSRLAVGKVDESDLVSGVEDSQRLRYCDSGVLLFSGKSRIQKGRRLRACRSRRRTSRHDV
jgi:hypothetical protein